MEIRKYFCMEPARTHNSPETPNRSHAQSVAMRRRKREAKGKKPDDKLPAGTSQSPRWVEKEKRQRCHRMETTHPVSVLRPAACRNCLHPKVGVRYQSDAADAAILRSPIRPTSSVTDSPIARPGPTRPNLFALCPKVATTASRGDKKARKGSSSLDPGPLATQVAIPATTCRS